MMFIHALIQKGLLKPSGDIAEKIDHQYNEFKKVKPQKPAGNWKQMFADGLAKKFIPL